MPSFILLGEEFDEAAEVVALGCQLQELDDLGMEILQDGCGPYDVTPLFDQLPGFILLR